MNSLPININIKFKTITQLIPKELGIRKKIGIYTAIDSLNQTYIFLHIIQKRRFLQKDVEKIEEIYTLVQNHTKLSFDKKYIIIEAPLCSKAKTKLENNSWNCENISL